MTNKMALITSSCAVDQELVAEGREVPWEHNG